MSHFLGNWAERVDFYTHCCGGFHEAHTSCSKSWSATQLVSTLRSNSDHTAPNCFIEVSYLPHQSWVSTPSRKESIPDHSPKKLCQTSCSSWYGSIKWREHGKLKDTKEVTGEENLLGFCNRGALALSSQSSMAARRQKSMCTPKCVHFLPESRS